MFTWICPQCGSEVAPSYSECPNCVARQAAAAAAPQQAPFAPQQPGQYAPQQPAQYAPPQPVQYAPQPVQYAPQPGYAAPPQQMPPPQAPQPAGQQQVQYVYVKRPGPPGWLVTLGVAAVFVILGGLFYSWMSRRDAARGEAESSKSVKSEEKGSAKKGTLSRYLEATGVRVVEEAKKPVLRVTLVNHSAAEMVGIEGTIVVSSTSGNEPVATLDFKVASLAPYEAKEITGPLKTKLRAYEMPDWQFLKAALELKGGE